MVLKVSLVLFSLVCVPCHARWSLWGLSSEAPKTPDSTIPPVTKPESSSLSSGTDNSKGVSDFNLFFDEPESSSSNRSDKIMETNFGSALSSLDHLNLDDLGVGMNDGKSSSQAPGGNRRAADESDPTTVKDDLGQNSTLVPEERDSETTAPTETTITTTDATTLSSTSKIIRMITSTSTQPSTSETTTSETTISSSSTTEEPSSTPTTTTEPTSTAKVESSTEIQSSTSIKPNKRSCEGPDCDEDAASDASETVHKIVSSESSSSPSASSTPFSSSSMGLNENTTLDNSTGQPAVDAERSANEVQNITVIAEPTKNGNLIRELEDSTNKISSTTKKPSSPSINPSKRPMSSSGLIVAPADKVSFLIVCITLFLSLKVTANTF